MVTEGAGNMRRVPSGEISTIMLASACAMARMALARSACVKRAGRRLMASLRGGLYQTDLAVTTWKMHARRRIPPRNDDIEHQFYAQNFVD